MANQKYIYGVADKISLQIETLQKSVVVDILNTVQKIQRAGTAATLIEILERFNFKEIIKIKAQNILVGYNQAHTQVLADMKVFGNVTEETLRALTNFSTSTFTDKLDDMANVMKSEIIKGALGAGTEATILEAIQSQSGLSNKQMKTLVTTGLNDYSRSVNKVMMDTLPNKTKYQYVGALDDRTRDECIDMISAGELTEQEIVSRFSGYGDVLISGGGFNCRHQWLPVAASTKPKDARTDA